MMWDMFLLVRFRIRRWRLAFASQVCASHVRTCKPPNQELVHEVDTINQNCFHQFRVFPGSLPILGFLYSVTHVLALVARGLKEFLLDGILSYVSRTSCVVQRWRGRRQAAGAPRRGPPPTSAAPQVLKPIQARPQLTTKSCSPPNGPVSFLLP